MAHGTGGYAQGMLTFWGHAIAHGLHLPLPLALPEDVGILNNVGAPTSLFVVTDYHLCVEVLQLNQQLSNVQTLNNSQADKSLQEAKQLLAGHSVACEKFKSTWETSKK